MIVRKKNKCLSLCVDVQAIGDPNSDQLEFFLVLYLAHKCLCLDIEWFLFILSFLYIEHFYKL